MGPGEPECSGERSNAGDGYELRRQGFRLSERPASWVNGEPLAWATNFPDGVWKISQWR